MKIHYKDKLHREDTFRILASLGKNNENYYFKDFYTGFAYLSAATGKTDYVVDFCQSDGRIVHKLFKAGLDGEEFTYSQKMMLLYALQLFNEALSDIKLGTVMIPLSKDQVNFVLEAIKIRYTSFTNL